MIMKVIVKNDRASKFRLLIQTLSGGSGAVSRSIQLDMGREMPIDEVKRIITEKLND